MDPATNAPYELPPLEPPPRRRWVDFALNVVLSGSFHAFLALFVLFLLIPRFGCGPSNLATGGQDGENGRGGSGGPTIEISIQGPESEHPAPITPGQTAPPSTEPTPPAPAPTPAETHPTHEHHVAAQTSPTPPPPSSSDENTVAVAPTAETTEAHPANEQQATGGGTGAEVTSGGRRPGSVGHQRSILPAAQACADPVAGVWRALKYDPVWGDWFHVTLRVHRNEDDTLEGAIVARMWDGGPTDVRPPVCGPDGFDFTVDMPGSGTVRGQTVSFGASSWHLRGYHCNALYRHVDYRPDHFTGTIDPRIQEFQSVNNDGGRAVNDPMVFRRIACLEGEAVEHGDGAGGNGGRPEPLEGAPVIPRETEAPARPTPPQPVRPAVPEQNDWNGTMPHFQ